MVPSQYTFNTASGGSSVSLNVYQTCKVSGTPVDFH